MNIFTPYDDVDVPMHLPGHAVLKLSDGRKRSMSLWVEFITASGYLSARKIRSRFHTLVAEAVEKSPYRDAVKVMSDTSDVKLRIQDKYVLQLTATFRVSPGWPKSVTLWPLNACMISWPQQDPIGSAAYDWPRADAVAEIKAYGFDLLRLVDFGWPAACNINYL